MKKNQKKVLKAGIINLILLLFMCITNAQTMNIDSLIQIASQMPNSEDKILLYDKIGDQYKDLGDIENSKQCFYKVRDLSLEIDYTYGILCYTVSMGEFLRYEGYYDSALVLNQQMLELALCQDDETIICKSYVNLGLSYENKGWWETALECYLTALSYAEKNDYKEALGVIYDMLQLLYQHTGDYQKAVYYGEKSAEILKEHPRLPQVLMRLTLNYINHDDFSKAEKSLQQIDSLLKLYPSFYVDAERYSLHAYLCIATGDWKKSQYYADTALRLFKIMEYPARITEMMLVKAKGDIYNKHLSIAKSKIDSVLNIAEEFQILGSTEIGMDLLSKVALLEGDIDAYHQWEHKTDSVRRLITDEVLWRTTEELAAKYETQKKDIQIEALAKESRLLFILLIACGTFILLIFAILIYRNRLHRKQKQLLVAQVALESETAERSRLAKDLHDGLGGMLSLVKINLNDMKGLKVMEQDDSERFGNALNMLDNSIAELRRVAHHIMPESLIRNGLKTSLGDFTDAVPNAEFHFFGTEKRLDSNLEVVLYRSAHELVNNALKYSDAKHINVQLVQEPDRISLTVADDGKGFDVKIGTKGSGLKNIKSRISVYNGEMNVFSDNTIGTEINIEIPLTDKL